MGFEPTTPTLARLCTIQLFKHDRQYGSPNKCKLRREPALAGCTIKMRALYQQTPTKQEKHPKAVELDAIDMLHLQPLVRKVIERHMTPATLRRLRAAERRERAEIQRIADGL